MNTATIANVRTAQAAHDKGSSAALTVAFFGGSVMGLSVAALGLIRVRRTYITFLAQSTLKHFMVSRWVAQL